MNILNFFLNRFHKNIAFRLLFNALCLNLTFLFRPDALRFDLTLNVLTTLFLNLFGFDLGKESSAKINKAKTLYFISD